MSVSVIILAYNQQDFIEKAIRGVFVQKIDFPVELIISDDCSPDKTNEVIQKVILQAPKHFTIKYFSHPKNLGSTPNFYFATVNKSASWALDKDGKSLAGYEIKENRNY